MFFATAQQSVQSEAKTGIIFGLIIFFVAVIGAVYKIISSHNNERGVKTTEDEVKEVLHS